MKHLVFALFIISFNSLLSQRKSINEFESKYMNWYNLDPKSDKKMGVSVNKTYTELLKDKEITSEIIVAVIDGGVDVYHEDLKDNLWINKNEIPDNNIDDDNNGYIDDIYGWNFLGNSKGENINEENLELTRILKELKQKYGGKTIDEISLNNTTEYTEYLKMSSEFDTTFKHDSQEYQSISQMRLGIEKALEYVSNESKMDIKTIDELKKVKSSDKQVQNIQKSLLKAQKKGLTLEYLKSAEDYYKSKVEYYYNLNFNPRAEIIGDSPKSIEDKFYGNNDVKGPDAFHGSFCAGIIAGKRSNNIGIDGINTNVKIMSLRAVPNGDEYDKDIALAIIYAVDNGAKVINMSFGKGYSPQKDFVDKAIKYADSKGVLLVHAAGNDANNIDFTPNFPTDSLNDGTYTSNVITVGASSLKRKKHTPGNFSNYGKKNVDIFAPGVDIVSIAPENSYDQGNGTSFAAPVVSGVAALILTYYPELTPKELKALLMESVTDISTKKMIIPFEEKTEKKKVLFSELCTSGGIVNAYNAFLKLQSKN